MFFGLLAISVVTIVIAITFAKYHKKRWYCWTFIGIMAGFAVYGLFFHNHLGSIVSLASIASLLPHTLSLHFPKKPSTPK